MDVTVKENKDVILANYTGGKRTMLTPTVLLYGLDKNAPNEYRGSYTSNPLSIFIKNFCDDNGYGERNSYGNVQPDQPYAPSQHSPISVDYGLWAKTRRFDHTDFLERVLKDDENAWVITFMNPACSSCKKFAPEWDRIQAFEIMRDRNVKFGFIDTNIQENKDVILQKYTGGISV